MKPIHVRIVTTAHPTDDVRVNHKIAQAFLDAGFRVSWVGPGYAFFDCKERADGIEFHLTQPISSRWDRLRAGTRIKALARRLDAADVYYAPDPDSAPIALDLARAHGGKVIFDIHEAYHGSLLDRWTFGVECGPLRRLIQNRIRSICSRCDLVMAVGAALLEDYCPSPEKGLVVRSCAPAWFAQGGPAEVRPKGLQSIVLMHGKAFLARGTLTVLRSVALAAEQADGIQVIMFSNGDPEKDPSSQAVLAEAARLHKESTLVLREGVPMEQMPNILRSCDVGLIAYGRDLGIDSLPNRLFEYMAVGLPIIAPSYSREIAKVIDQEQCGLLVDFEDPATIAAAILDLQKDPERCREMGRRAREGFLLRHNWDTEVSPLISRIRSWFTLDRP